MLDTEIFGKIVRERRVDMGMSLKTASELCGMSEKGLAYIELGSTNPKLSNVLNIASVFKINLGELNNCVPDISAVV